MARTANAAVAAQWRERLADWRRSQLSVAEFCRREHLSEPSFYQWRRRLERRQGHEAPRFVELPAATWPAPPGVQVTLPSGAVVTLPAQASSDLVTAVIRAALLAPGKDERC